MERGLIIPGDRDFRLGPDEINRAHDYSDVDIDRNSQHHTLGLSATQASPGNHNHGMRVLLDNWLGTKTGSFSIPSSENPCITVWRPAGFYDTQGNAFMPDTGWWLILHLRHTNPSNNYGRQLAFGFANARTNYTRAIDNNVATGWSAVGF
jgi:hypothetical protein